MKREKEQKKKSEGKREPFFFLLFTFFAIIILGYVYRLPHADTGFNNEKAGFLNEGWSYTDHDGETKLITTFTDVEPNMDQGIRVTNTLPSKTELTYNCIAKFCAFQECRIYIDGELIEDTTDPNHAMRSFDGAPGNYWSIIRLPGDCAGKEITMEITSPYGDYQKITGNVLLGTKSSIIFKIIELSLWNVLMAAVFVTLGIGTLVLCAIFYRRLHRSSELIYLGWVLLWAGLWGFSESGLTQLLIRNATMTNVLSFMSMMLMTLSFMEYYKQIEKYHWLLFQKFLTGLLYVTAAGVTLLQLFKIFDYYETLSIFHAVMICSLIFTVFSTILEVFYFKNAALRFLLCCEIVLVAATGIELYIFYYGGRFGVGRVLMTGFFFSVVIILKKEIREAFGMMEKGELAGYYEELATVDTMTGCKNRTSFQTRMAEIDEGLLEKSRIAVVMCDVNRLKHINDCYGHNQGDVAIRTCASLIMEIFGSYGDCYRTGGDEFTCILYDCETELLQVYTEAFLERCAEEDEKLEFEFRAAVGFALYDVLLDKKLENAVHRADEKMYEMKNRMKETK